MFADRTGYKTEDLEEQYDKVYRYCYFKVRNRELAEDITQETFLRFLEKGIHGRRYVNMGKSLQYLYTIARNLCIDEYRKKDTAALEEEVEDSYDEDAFVLRLSVKMALDRLDEADRELLLLRYVNEVSVSALGKFYGISRYALYRRLSGAVKRLKENLGKEGPL